MGEGELNKSNKNLVPITNRAMSEQREIQSKGGKARAAKMRRNKSLKKAVIAMLEGTYEHNGKKVDGYELAAVGLFRKMKFGDVAAFNAARDLIGEKPVDKVDVEGNIPLTVVIQKNYE